VVLYGNRFSYGYISQALLNDLNTHSTSVSTVNALAIGPAGEWVVIYNNRFYDRSNIPSGMQTALNQGGTLSRVAIGPNGSWATVRNANDFAVQNAPDEVLTDLNAARNGNYVITGIAFGKAGSSRNSNTFAITYGRNGFYTSGSLAQSSAASRHDRSR